MADQPRPAGAGSFCWNELMSRDVPGAREFYSKVLGWTFEEMDMGEAKYTIFKRGEEMVAGLMEMPPNVPAQVPPHWMSYVEVSDLEATVGRVQENGGETLVPPTEIPNMGRFSVVQDPTGAAFALFVGAADAKEC